MYRSHDSEPGRRAHTPFQRQRFTRLFPQSWTPTLRASKRTSRRPYSAKRRAVGVRVARRRSAGSRRRRSSASRRDPWWARWLRAGPRLSRAARAHRRRFHDASADCRSSTLSNASSVSSRRWTCCVGWGERTATASPSTRSAPASNQNPESDRRSAQPFRSRTALLISRARVDRRHLAVLRRPQNDLVDGARHGVAVDPDLRCAMRCCSKRVTRSS
jgi:hypothetical protein